jgi:hypothetical protein
MFSSRRSRNRHSANPNPKLHVQNPKRKIPEPVPAIGGQATLEQMSNELNLVYHERRASGERSSGIDDGSFHSGRSAATSPTSSVGHRSGTPPSAFGVADSRVSVTSQSHTPDDISSNAADENGLDICVNMADMEDSEEEEFVDDKEVSSLTSLNFQSYNLERTPKDEPEAGSPVEKMETDSQKDEKSEIPRSFTPEKIAVAAPPLVVRTSSKRKSKAPTRCAPRGEDLTYNELREEYERLKQLEQLESKERELADHEAEDLSLSRNENGRPMISEPSLLESYGVQTPSEALELSQRLIREFRGPLPGSTASYPGTSIKASWFASETASRAEGDAVASASIPSGRKFPDDQISNTSGNFQDQVNDE